MSFSPDISAIVEFSKHLKEARAFREVSLRDIEIRTNISEPHLIALETARWDRIPSGFVRGYVGLYAEAVGMNRAKVLRDCDAILSGRPTGDQAELVNSRPLLGHPLKVGLTRAKITAAWFSDLAARSHFKAVLTVLVLLVVIAGPLWLRIQTEETPIEPLSVSVTLEEYREQTHGPLTIIPLSPAEDTRLVARSDGAWVKIIAHESGRIAYRQDERRSRSISVCRLDTLEIQYDSSLSLRVNPVGSVSVIVEDGYEVDSGRVGQTMSYRIGKRLIIAEDPLSGEVNR